MIGGILVVVLLVGAGFVLGYLTKQEDIYERGYFFGRADGRTEVFDLWKKEKNNKDNDAENGSNSN